jgi:Zn-dependent protease
MDGQGIRVGSVLGAPIMIRPSWFLVAGVVTLAFAPRVVERLPGTGPGAAYLTAAAFALVLFASVFLHELAHALTARAVGSPPAFIVLDVWGGHTAFSAELISPGRSVLVAAAGPLTNAALAIAGLAVRSQVPAGGVAHLLLLALALSNGFVALFNALPGMPLDGGRILEGIIWAVRGERAAGTLAAGWGGRLVAVGVAGFAVLWSPLTRGRADIYSLVSLLAVAALLWHGASQTIRLAQWRRRAPGVTVQALLRPAVTVPLTVSLAEAQAAAQAHGVSDLVLLDGDGRPSALLDQLAAGSVPDERAATVAVDAVARNLAEGAVLADDLAGDPLVERMQQSPSLEYAVVDATGSVIGVLLWKDVAARVAGR